MKKILSLVLVVLMVAGCCAALSSCAYTDTINIGLSGPLTGPAATYGIAVENSAKMAIDEINAAGGLKNGVKLELLSTDDEHKASKVPTNFANMLSSGMQVALGCVTSDPCKEFASLSYENNVFFLTPSASADSVVSKDNAYQMCFADGNQGAVAAEYVNSLYTAGTLGKLGILYKAGDVYSQGIYEQFMDNLNAELKAAVANDVASYTGEDSSVDFTAQVNVLSDCTFIFMPIYYTPAAKFMNAANGKIANNATYYGCDGLDGIDGSIEGFNLAAIPQKVSMLSHFNSKATEGKAAEYIAAYKAKYGEDAPLNQFGASAYDCVYAIAGALNAAIDEGKNVDGASAAAEICEILKEKFNNGYKFSGATGTDITWDASGFVKKGAVAYVVKGFNG